MRERLEIAAISKEDDLLEDDKVYDILNIWIINICLSVKTYQMTDRRTEGLIGKLHFKYEEVNANYLLSLEM